MQRTIASFFVLFLFSVNVFSQHSQPYPDKLIVWSALPPDVKGSFTNMCVFNGKLYVSGIDSVGKKAKNLACWDGKKWSSPDSGLHGKVTAMCEYNGKLYAGVEFVSNDFRYINLMCWNEKAWQTVAPFNESINALCTFNGELYIGGAFTKVDSISARHVVRWCSDTGWRKVGKGAENIVKALKVYHEKIYIGGQFSPVIRWDGKVLEDVVNEKGPIIMRGWIKNFMPFFNQLYACGDFDYLLAWDENKWTPVGSFSDMVSTMAVYNGGLYIGGDFVSVPANERAYHIARYDYHSDLWNCVGGVMNFAGDCQAFTGTISSMAVYNNELYVGGQFMIAGGKIAFNIAKMKFPEPKKDK